MRPFCKKTFTLAVAVTCILLAGVAQAATMTFDFNSLAVGGNVQTYMNGILQALNPAWSVTVTGAYAEKAYTGDGHAVGTGNSGVVSQTLGTTDGAKWVGGLLKDAVGNAVTAHATSPDMFIDTYSSTQITMTFSGFTIASAAFDYEIFPSSTCANYSTCGASNYPDFTFKADGVQKLYTTGLAPTLSADLPNNSPMSYPELAPQFLGLSGTISLSGVVKLEFIDWPVTIGIDNLVITTTCTGGSCFPSVPEPSSLLLLGTGLIGMAGVARGFRKR